MRLETSLQGSSCSPGLQCPIMRQFTGKDQFLVQWETCWQSCLPHDSTLHSPVLIVQQSNVKIIIIIIQIIIKVIIKLWIRQDIWGSMKVDSYGNNRLSNMCHILSPPLTHAFKNISDDNISHPHTTHPGATLWEMFSPGDQIIRDEGLALVIATD